MYAVLELQRSGESTLTAIVNTYTDKNVAEQKYHQILSAAAVSNVDIHSAVMLDETGRRIKSETYEHITPTPEEPTEPVEE